MPVAEFPLERPLRAQSFFNGDEFTIPAIDQEEPFTSALVLYHFPWLVDQTRQFEERHRRE